MKKKACIFLANCVMGNKNACTTEETAGCGQAIERQKRADQDCPIMVETGGTNKKCHISQLLQFLPLISSCHSGKDCLVCKMIPDTVAEVAKHNSSDGRSKMSDEDIEKAGATLIKTLKIKEREAEKTKNTAVAV